MFIYALIPEIKHNNDAIAAKNINLSTETMPIDLKGAVSLSIERFMFIVCIWIVFCYINYQKY
jgi:hypothetical protein